MAPFGTTSSLLTTPAFSSTTLLPIQISEAHQRQRHARQLHHHLPNPTYWDSNFEFWISKNDPTTNTNAGVYAEIIAFLGWESTGRLGTTARRLGL